MSVTFISNLIAYMFDCRTDLGKLRHPLRMIKALLRLEDEIAEFRVDAVFNYHEHGSVYNVLEKLEGDRFYNGYVAISLNFIAEIAKEFEEVKRYLNLNISKLGWVLPFLRLKDGYIHSYARLDYEIASYPGLPKAEFLAENVVKQFIDLFG